ncbi:MAG: long-chain fatty acid--CoA ligase [Bacteroidetes bacterium]|nr:MAG: long-chain fatty acid--CoA ligase [Bacteroidota bacterium]
MYTLKDIDNLSLISFLENSVKKFPDLPAVGFVGEEPIKYKDFGNTVNRLAFHLQAHGVKKDDKIAIWSENSPNWLITYFAILKLGAVAVPILPDFSSAAIDNILKHSEAKGLFVSKSLYRKLYKESTQKIEILVLLDDFTIHVNKEGEEKKADFEKFCDLNKEDLNKLSTPEIKPEDLASIIYTSGTTGTSKGVMLTHRNLVSNTIQGYYTFPIDEKARFLSILPMSHTLEFTLGNLFPIMCGASTRYIKKPPTAAVLMPALKEVKPTIMLTVPMIIEKIYKSKVRPSLTKNGFLKMLYGFAPTRKLLHKAAGKQIYSTFGGHLQFFGIGGAKLDKDVERFLKEANFPYAIGYGLTETSPLAAGTTPGKPKLGSTGPAITGVTIKIINPDKDGEGEIVIYGPNVMKGYYKADDLNKEVFTEDGGFKTGDTGILDEDGFLFIKGRIKNMILGPSGENIFPEEIEAAINKSEWVLESLVYELKGKIVARVEINQEELNKHMKKFRGRKEEMEKEVNAILENIKKSVNEEVNRFSRLNGIFQQKEPFIKTPTKKIKRFLYQDKEPDENPVDTSQDDDKK